MADSAIQLTTALPYELLYKIMRHLDPDDLDQLRRVNKTLWSMVWNMRPGEQMVWQPMRLLQLPNYQSRQIVARRAITYQPDETTVRDLTMKAFTTGNLPVVRFHLTNDSDYFPQIDDTPLLERENSDALELAQAIVNDSDEEWIQYAAEVLHMIHTASPYAFEVMQWARATQTDLDRMRLLNLLVQTPLSDRRAYHIKTVSQVLQDVREDLTPRIILNLMHVTFATNTEISNILADYLHPYGPFTLSDMRDTRQLALTAFKSGNLETLRYYFNEHSAYFPAPEGRPGIFFYIQIILNDSTDEWVQYSNRQLSDTIARSATRLYEIIEWARNTQRNFNVWNALSAMEDSPFQFDARVRPAIDAASRHVYRNQLYARLLEDTRSDPRPAKICARTFSPDRSNVDIRMLRILEMMRHALLCGNGTYAWATFELLRVVVPVKYEETLHWIYFHDSYTIPGDRRPELYQLMFRLATNDVAEGFARIAPLVTMDRSCLRDVVFNPRDRFANENWMTEVVALAHFNDIDTGELIEPIIERMSWCDATNCLYPMSILKQLARNGSILDMLRPLASLYYERVRGRNSLVCRILSIPGCKTSVTPTNEEMCMAGAILDDVFLMIDALPYVQTLRQEICNLAMKMASLGVLDYMQSDWNVAPDSATVRWACQYGTVSAIRFHSMLAATPANLAAAIETGNVEVALYLRDTLDVIMPSRPHITTVRMAEALNIIPDMMELCREGNLALLSSRTPDPALFLDVVALGNGRVIEWFIDNCDNLPLHEACRLAERNSMWHLYHWLIQRPV